MKLLPQFSEFIIAREDLRVVKESKLFPPPWTDDPILHTYRFCNINREHDTVTKGIRRMYRKMPNNDLWFHLVVARLFNHIPTLELFSTLRRDSWETKIKLVCDDMEAEGQRVFNPAYIVSTNGKQMAKVPYLIEFVLRPLARMWGEGTPQIYTCEGWARFLLGYNGLGDFMVNQIVTDMKYTTLLQDRAKDWTSFVMAGPGTKRGLNRLFGRDTKASLGREQAQNELMAVRQALRHHPLVHYFSDLNNLSNSFCEFDKYQRVVTGQGKPKQRYHHA